MLPVAAESETDHGPLRLRYVISTGESFAASIAKRFRTNVPGLQVIDCYGATEFSNAVSQVLPPVPPRGRCDSRLFLTIFRLFLL